MKPRFLLGAKRSLQNGAVLSLNGVAFTAQAASTNAIRFDPSSKRVDFERLAGQQRNELTAPRMAIGATQRWTYSFIVHSVDDGDWDSVGQIHGLNDELGRSAPWALFREKNGAASEWRFRTRATDVGGVVQNSVAYDVSIALGTRYAVDHTWRQHATLGVCQTKFGLYGQTLPTIINETGRIGFPDEEAGQPADNGPYFKFGLYGDTANTTGIRVSFYDVTLQ